MFLFSFCPLVNIYFIQRFRENIFTEKEKEQKWAKKAKIQRSKQGIDKCHKDYTFQVY